MSMMFGSVLHLDSQDFRVEPSPSWRHGPPRDEPGDGGCCHCSIAVAEHDVPCSAQGSAANRDCAGSSHGSFDVRG